MRRGGVVKVFDSVLMSGSQYKSLLIAEHTTVGELIQLILNCYSCHLPPVHFSLYEVCQGVAFERKLHPDNYPLLVTRQWGLNTNLSLVLKQNPENTHAKVSNVIHLICMGGLIFNVKT